jgi:Uma2 family endonuclease
VATVLPWGEPLSVEDLDSMPDDGHRYELIDGVLVVTPAPAVPHQVVVGGVLRALWHAHTEDTIVLPAPVDWVPGPSTLLQPDVVVAERGEAGEPRLTRPPLLVVEVLSPSTRRYDLGSKGLAYAGYGVPAYWVVDPEPPVTLLVFRSGGDVHTEVARVQGEEAYRATVPFEVTIVPARLADL